MPTKKGADKPIAFRAKAETMVKVRKIAEANGVSIADVINLGLAAGLNIVETKLGEINKPEAAAVAGAGK